MIGLGSGSPLKRLAVELAFPGREVKTFEFESSVSDQPVGEKETQQGAEYRATKAKELFPQGDIWIGIENGIIHEGNSDNIYKGWVDIACVVLLTKDGEQACLWSDKLKIRSSDMKQCLHDNGHVHKTWSDLKDPHTEYTNGEKPRRIFLRDVLLRAKEELTLC